MFWWKEEDRKTKEEIKIRRKVEKKRNSFKLQTLRDSFVVLDFKPEIEIEGGGYKGQRRDQDKKKKQRK